MSDISARARYARDVVRHKLAAELSIMSEAELLGPDDAESAPQAAPEAETVAITGFTSHFTPTLGFISPGDITPENLPQDPRLVGENRPPSLWPGQGKICIVGAGVAGLYIAMILDSLQIPGLEYEILEASDRLGGRLDTYKFSDTPHDYFDIGAMRYPDLKIMRRTFKLFEQLKLPLVDYYLDEGTVNCPSRFNDEVYVDKGQKPPPDVYRVSVKNKGSVPDRTIKKGVTAILDEAFGPFKTELRKDWKSGFEKLKTVDKYSTRQYLREVMGYDFYSIQWMETQNTSSGLFDQAFSESVIDSFDFEAPKGEKIKWKCIDGGSSLITERMRDEIKGPIYKKNRVSRVALDGTSSPSKMIVQCPGEPPRNDYITVFNTTSLGCLQRMDLRDLKLHPSQKDAIRCLHYDDSAKVAIKFKYPWWIKDCGITSGGIGSTDLPLRTCVYPSYNLKDGDKSAVLLCSYTWSQDATRIGSLITKNSPEGEDELKELLLTNLALLHEKSFGNLTYQQIRDKIAGAYDTHKSFSWSHDPYTSGAFALFGPGQFENLYTYLMRPAADGLFHIVGEASSAHHAWVVGALDSAYAAVDSFLNRFNMFDSIDDLKEKWGKVEELERGKDGTVHLQVFLSCVPEEKQVKVAPAVTA